MAVDTGWRVVEDEWGNPISTPSAPTETTTPTLPTGRYFSTPTYWSITSLADVPRIVFEVNYLGTFDTDDVASFEYGLYYDGNSDGTYCTAYDGKYVSNTKKAYAYISVVSNDAENREIYPPKQFVITEPRKEKSGKEHNAKGEDIPWSWSRLYFKSDKETISEGTFTVKKSTDLRTINFTISVNFMLDSYGNEQMYAAKAIDNLTYSTKTYAKTGYTYTTGNYTIPALSSDYPSAEEETTEDPTSTDTPDDGTARVFTVDWSPPMVFDFDKEAATSAPGKPVLSIDGTELTITLDKSKTLDSDNDVKVVFEVVKDDKALVYGANDAVIYAFAKDTLTNIMEVTCQVDIGHRYKARCRSIKIVGDKEYPSEWSEWSDSVSAAPLRPEGLTCIALSSNGVIADSIHLSWSPCTTAKTYVVRYVAPDKDSELTVEQMFELGPYTENGTEDGVSECILGPVDTGKTYHIGVCAVGESEERSEWSKLVSVTLGSAPAAPTTWSSRSIISSGESVTLHWTHNSTDGSSEVFAKPTIYVNDTLYPTDYVYRTTRFKTDMEVYAGRYYTNGTDKFLCIQNGYPKSIDAPEYFTKVEGGYSDNEASFYVLNTGMSVLAGCYYKGDDGIYQCIKSGTPSALTDSEYFKKVDALEFSPGCASDVGQHWTDDSGKLYLCVKGTNPDSLGSTLHFTKLALVRFVRDMVVVSDTYYISEEGVYFCKRSSSPQSIEDTRYFTPVTPVTYVEQMDVVKGTYYVYDGSMYLCKKSSVNSLITDDAYFEKIVPEEFTSLMDVTSGVYYSCAGRTYLCTREGRGLPGGPSDSEFFDKVEPIVFDSDSAVVDGSYYTDGVGDGLYKCIKDNTVDSLSDNPAYFAKVDIGTFNSGSTLFADGAKVKWFIQTAGVSNELGPASTTREITVYAPPKIELSVTDHTGTIFDTLTSLPIHVSALTSTPAQRPIGYHMTIEVKKNGQGSYVTADPFGDERTVHEGEVIYSKYFDTNEPLEATLSAGDVTLVNNIKYMLTVTASMDSGLSANESTEFTVSWERQQYLPMATILVNKNIFATAVCPYCEETTKVKRRATRHVTKRNVNGEEKEYVAYTASSEYAPKLDDLLRLQLPPRYIGKNRLDMSDVRAWHNCSWFTDLRGLNLIKESDISYVTLLPMYLVEGTKYVLSFKTTSPTSNFLWVDIDDKPVTGFNIKTFTPSKAGYYSIRFYNDGDIGSVVTISNAQVEKGSRSTEYEEYRAFVIPQECTVDGQLMFYTDCGGTYICNNSGSAESIDQKDFFAKVVIKEWFPGQIVENDEHFIYDGSTYRCIKQGSPSTIDDGEFFVNVSDEVSNPRLFSASMLIVEGSHYLRGSYLYRCLESGTVTSINDDKLELVRPTVWITGMVPTFGKYYTDGVGTYLCTSEGDPDVLSDSRYFEKIVPEQFSLTMSVTEDDYYTFGPEGTRNYYCEVEETVLTDDVLLSVYRRNYDGTYTEISKNKENTRIYAPDPHPSLDYARYRVVAMSKKTGAVSYNDLPSQKIGCKSVIIQWDEDWNDYHSSVGTTTEKTWSGSMLKLPYNIDVSDKRSTEVEMVKYVGRKHPVSYYGTQLGETATWSCVIPKADTDTIYALRRLAAWAGDVYVREPSGVGYWANITVNFSLKHNQLTVPVSFDITRVEGGV